MFKEQDNFTKIVPSDTLVLLKNSFMEKNYLLSETLIMIFKVLMYKDFTQKLSWNQVKEPVLI